MRRVVPALFLIVFLVAGTLLFGGCEGVGSVGAPAERTDNKQPADKTEPETPPAAPTEASDYVGITGGKVSFQGFTLAVPREALRTKEYLTVRYPVEQDKRVVTGTDYQILPTGLSFNKPALVTIKYDPGNLGLYTADDLAVAFLADGAWQEISASQVEIDETTVSAPVDFLGEFALVVKATSMAIVNSAPEPKIKVAMTLLDDGTQRAEYDAGGSVDDDGKIVRYDWDFDGDGVFDYSSPVSATASHIFPKVGEYTTVLKVTDNHHEPATAYGTSIVDIEPLFPPAPAEKLDIAFSISPSTGKVPITLQFAASAIGGLPPYHILWEFEDGTSAETMNPAFKFLREGTHTIDVHLRDESGQELGRQVKITLKGKGAPAISNESFKAQLLASAAKGKAPFTVGFTLALRNGRDPVKWNVEYGDEAEGASPTQGSGTTFSHTYAQPGLYIARIIVTDANKSTATSFVLVEAAGDETAGATEGGNSAAPDSGAPFGDVKLSATRSGESPLSFAFDVKGLPESSKPKIKWDFGDGFSVSDTAPAHDYQEGGEYRVKARIELDGVTVTREVKVPAGDGPSVAVQLPDKLRGLAPFTVSAEAMTAGLPTPVTYAWDFGDGEKSGDSSPRHTYAAEGSYTLALSVSSGDKKAASPTVSVTVLPAAKELSYPVACLVERVVDGAKTGDADLVLYDAAGEGSYKLPPDLSASENPELVSSLSGGYIGYRQGAAAFLVNAASGETVLDLKPSDGRVDGVFAAKFGDPVFVNIVGVDGKAKAFEYSRAAGLAELPGADGESRVVAVSGDGRAVLLKRWDKDDPSAIVSLQKRDPTTGEWAEPVDLMQGALEGAMSEDAGRILVLLSDFSVNEVSSDSPESAQVAGKEKEKSALFISADGDSACWLEGGGEGERDIVVAQRTKEGHLAIRNLSEKTGVTASGVALSPDGKMLVAYGTGKPGVAAGGSDESTAHKPGIYAIRLTGEDPKPVFIAACMPYFAALAAQETSHK